MPVGVATLLLGFFVLVVRRRPIFQMVGLLLVDNGIALVAFLCTAGVPFLIELGVSLDVLLGVVVLMVLAQRLRARVRRCRPRRAAGAARLMVLVLIIVLPLLGGGRRRRLASTPSAAWAAVATNGAALALGMWTAVRVVRIRSARTGLPGVLRADALSAFMVIVIGAIALLASWLGIRTIAIELADGRCTPAARHHLWRLGPGLRRRHAARRPRRQRRRALGGGRGDHRRHHLPGRAPPDQGSARSLVEVHRDLLGRDRSGLLGHRARVPLLPCTPGGHSAGALDWTSLMANARHLDPSVLRLGFALVVLGYGTKVGLAPMHSWLPDAHSQAPAPISALMSGRAPHGGLLRHLALQGGDRPRPRTRLLAHRCSSSWRCCRWRSPPRCCSPNATTSGCSPTHSIEHMGLIALGAAAGIPLAIAAVLLHILGHGLAKSVLFLTSGEIMAAEGTSQIDGVRALLARRPALGGVFGVGLGGPARASAVQPLLQRAAHGPGRVRGRAGLGRRGGRGRHGGHLRRRRRPCPPHAPRPRRHTEPLAPPPHWVAAPLVGGLVVCGLIGVFAWPLSGLLQAAAHVVAP